MNLASRFRDDRRRRKHVDQTRAAALADLGGSDAALAAVIDCFGRGPSSPEIAAWVERLEGRRRALLASDEKVLLLRADGPQATTVAEVCARTSKDDTYCHFLLELAASVDPRVCVEMGTSIGVSGSYLAAGLTVAGHGGRLVTLDRQEHVAGVVRRDLPAIGLSNVQIVLGSFDDTFPSVLRDHGPVGLLFIDGNHHEEPTLAYFEAALPHLDPGAVVVFDDIGWSDGMRAAWSRLQRHPAVAASATLGVLGIVRVPGASIS